MQQKQENWAKRRRRYLWSRNHHCVYCGCPMDLVSVTLDHIQPKSKGGSNRSYNTVSACGVCNKEKADRTPEQWAFQATSDALRLSYRCLSVRARQGVECGLWHLQSLQKACVRTTLKHSPPLAMTFLPLLIVLIPSTTH